MLEIKNVTKKYNGITAIEDISAVLDSGGIYGLVGYNGAGKTTLLKTAAGIYRPESGIVTIDGAAVFNNEKLHRKMIVLPDEPYFLPQASLYTMRHFYRGYYPLWSDNAFAKLTKLFNLEPSAKINGFSKGMQRQAAILLALSAMPEYIFMDEVFDGLDLSKRMFLKRLLKDYAKKRNAAVFVSSHNLSELEDFAGHIIMIRDKRLYFNGTVEDMQKSRSKYKAVFACDLPDGILSQIKAKCVQHTSYGTYTFVTDSEDAETVLSDFNPIEITRLGVTLEEFFLEETGEENYVFEEIF